MQTQAMTQWIRGARLGMARTADLFFGRSESDPVVLPLQKAALYAATASTQADMAAASRQLAEAMQTVGVSQWPRFIADAHERVSTLAVQTAITNSQLPKPPGSDAIRPVYPIEALAGIAAAGVVGGAVVAREVGTVVAKQVIPSRPNTKLQGAAFPKQELPRTKNGIPVPEPEAEGLAHTQLGTVRSKNYEYPQAREFDAKGQPVRDIDFTDHGRPASHTNPHQHLYRANKTGGSPNRANAQSLE